jgi:hypothetical protein
VIFVHWNGKPQANRNHNSYSQQKEGEINLSQTRQQNKSSNDSGEYVDYEELPPEKMN